MAFSPVQRVRFDATPLRAFDRSPLKARSSGLIVPAIPGDVVINIFVFHVQPYTARDFEDPGFALRVWNVDVAEYLDAIAEFGALRSELGLPLQLSVTIWHGLGKIVPDTDLNATTHIVRYDGGSGPGRIAPNGLELPDQTLNPWVNDRRLTMSAFTPLSAAQIGGDFINQNVQVRTPGEPREWPQFSAFIGCGGAWFPEWYLWDGSGFTPFTGPATILQGLAYDDLEIPTAWGQPPHLIAFRSGSQPIRVAPWNYDENGVVRDVLGDTVRGLRNIAEFEGVTDIDLLAPGGSGRWVFELAAGIRAGIAKIRSTQP